MRQPHLSRRALLAAGAAAVALAGCSAPPDPEPVRDTPEQALARTLIADKERTIALYSALIDAGGDDQLAARRAHHQAHLAELRRRYPGLRASGSPSPTTSAASSGTPTATPAPTVTPAMTPSRLRALERQAAARRPDQLAGVAPALAQLVASIGACEVLHAATAVKPPAPPPAPPASGPADPGDVEKLRKALAAEHAAVFAYGVLGARTSGSLRDRLTRAFAAHRDRRDELRRLITARGGRPAEPQPSYALPSIPSSGPAAARLAAHVETGLTASYLELVAATDAALRRYAAVAVQEAVTRGHSFRPGPATAFPGLPAPAPASPSPTPSPGG
ncbi:ferritin-like domain-containing protein [Nonomuraea sp. MCN248]|uniref:Ferritin-like domain-containing protein n=1 Tax=Nonomuraea corallina TaxID=2989783 RepID=A0ABT4SL33_9ACTN|nr:ferritin-like domain-containing protein [Nonomuraea corallina]MDA0637616.1 ferritin-like domain-containing protein [Nonomuraea corallina]